MAIQGTCLCGTLRYEITARSSTDYCIVRDAAKQHGAPFATIAQWQRRAHWLAEQDAAPRRAAARATSVALRFAAPISPSQLVSHLFRRTREGERACCRAPSLRVKAPCQHPDGSAHRLSTEFVSAQVFPIPPPADRCGPFMHLLARCVYEFEAVAFQCHCTRCRKARGSAHGANLFCKLEDFHWTRGEGKVVDFALPGARFYGVAFCRQCGASVPRLSVGRGIAVIPASGLDTDPGLTPTAHIFVESKAPWFEITDDLPQYAEGPPPFAPPR